MEYARAARLVGRQVRSYINDILPLVQDTVSATATAVLLQFRLLYHLVRPLILLIPHLYRLLTPPIAHLISLFYRAFSSQPPKLLAAESFLFLTLLALLLLERKFRFYARISTLYKRTTRRIAQSYKSFHKELRQKSRLSAAALPHLLFGGVAFAFHVTMAEFIAPVTKGPAVVLLACIKPAVSTVRLLYTVDEELDDDTDEPATPTVPNTPVVTSASSDTDGDPFKTPVTRRRRRPLHEEPDTGSVRRRVRIDETPRERTITPDAKPTSNTRRRKAAVTPSKDVDEYDSQIRARLETETLRFWVVFGLIWATRTIAWYFCPPFLVSILTRLDATLPYIFLWLQLGLTRGANLVYAVVVRFARQRWQLEQDPNRVNALLRIAVATGLVSLDRAESVASTFTESGLALVGLVFLITPRIATFIGTVLVGLLVPCYLSVGVLERGKGDRHNWLSYWGVYSLFDAAFSAAEDTVGWVPLWYHAKMLVILWLQVPYYRGCVTVLDWCMGHVGVALSTVRNQVMTPRKRKRA